MRGLLSVVAGALSSVHFVQSPAASAVSCLCPWDSVTSFCSCCMLFCCARAVEATPESVPGLDAGDAKRGPFAILCVRSGLHCVLCSSVLLCFLVRCECDPTSFSMFWTVFAGKAEKKESKGDSKQLAKSSSGKDAKDAKPPVPFIRVRFFCNNPA